MRGIDEAEGRWLLVVPGLWQADARAQRTTAGKAQSGTMT